MKRLLMSVAVMCVYATMAFAGQQDQKTQSADNNSAVASMPETNTNTTKTSSKAQEKEQKKNRRKAQKEDNRTQEEKDFDHLLQGIYGG